jgi:hypothetical protein
MRYILFNLFLLFSLGVLGQQVNNSTGVKYFSQAELNDDLSEFELSQIEQDLSQNPNVMMSRLDRITGGLFIVTNTLNQYDRSTFESWLGAFSNRIDCYREGVHGIDEVIPFNSDFCNQSE